MLQLVPFGKGEQITFGVSYGFLHMGTLKLQCEGVDTLRGYNAYVFHMTARTKGAANAFFRINDNIYSFVDTGRFQSLRYEKKIEEGKFRSHLTIDYFPDSGFAVYSVGKKRESIPPCALDPLSVYYYVRTVPLVPGKTINIPYHVDRRSRTLTIHVDRHLKKCKTPDGKKLCFVLKPDFKGANIINSGGSMEMWLTDDSLKIPVLIKTKLFFGSLKGKIEQYRR